MERVDDAEMSGSVAREAGKATVVPVLN